MESIRLSVERGPARSRQCGRRCLGAFRHLTGHKPDRRSDVFRNCLACHNDDVIRQQRLTRGQWTAEINKMTGWGARIDEAGRNALLDYLDKLR
jgi:hypothetical protein